MSAQPFRSHFLRTTSHILAAATALSLPCSAVAQVTISSIVSTPGGTAISSPLAAYADPYGNLFVTNTSGTSVVKIPADGSPTVTIVTGLTSAVGVAADHAGNVYVAQTSVTSILKVPAGGGINSTVGTGIGRPFQLAMDAQDNLYVADSSNARIVKLVPSTGAQTVLAFTGLTNPHGVAVDSAGDVFVTSYTGSPAVTELTAGGVQIAIPLSGMTDPYGIAVDAAGRLDIVDAGGSSGRLLQYAPPFSATETPVILASALGTAAKTVSLMPNSDIVYQNGSKVYTLSSYAANALGTAVLGTSGLSTITFNFASAKTLGTPIFSSNGASTAQFKDGGANTCAGKTIVANGTCVVNVSFTPTQVGLATGTLTLVDSASNVLATVPLLGTGDGAAAAFTPGLSSNVATSFTTPEGVALDAGGNLYIVDNAKATVTRITSAGISSTLAFSGLARPFGVAVDGSGAVYVSDTTNGTVLKLSTLGAQTTVLTGLNAPMGIALDGEGSLYVANSGKGTVVKLDVLGNQSTLGFSGLAVPSWVAVDIQGDVFVSDSGSVQELAVGRSASSQLVVTGLGAAVGLASGLNGTLYIADSTNRDVVQWNAGISTTLGNGIASPAGLAAAPTGSLYVASATGGTVTLLDRTRETMTFASTAVGNTSAAMTASVQNVGNQSLAVSGFAVSTGFSQVSPLTSTDCAAPSTIAAGASCNLNLTFSPSTLGPNSGTATLTDNALNAAAATQAVQLIGIGLRASVTTVAQSVPASGNSSYGQSVSLLASVAPQSGTGTATGSVTFTLDGGAPSSAIPLSNGQATYAAIALVAGTHTVTVAYSGDTTFAASNSSTTPFTVSPAVLTVTATSQSRAYGVANPTLTYSVSGFQYSDTGSVVSGAPVLSTTATTASDPGQYPITVGLGTLAAANYTFSAVSGTLTVTQAGQTITFPAIANVTYGASPITLGATANSGLSVTYSILSGPASVTNGAGAAVTITGAGTVRVVANQAGNADYAAAPQVTQTFVVAPAVVTLTANNLSKQTGQANPVLTYSVSGFVNGDTSAVLSGSPMLSTTATTTSPSGTYPITIGQGTLSAASYTFAFVNGVLTVTGSTPQSITFGALPNVTYGVGPITLTATASSGAAVAYTVTGPATLSGSVLTITGAGTVSVTASQAGNATYAAATSATQNFTVSRATLLVTPADATRVINTTNPAFTYMITGFVNGDQSTVVSGAPVLSSTATMSSPVGSYPITATAGTLVATNYVFTFGRGTLIVTAAPQTIAFNTLPSVTYGVASITLAATASSSLPVTYTVTGPATLSGSALALTGVGSVSVIASQPGNATYAAATSVTQTFTVTPATLTVTPGNVTINFGAAIPTTFSYTITGFVNGDSQSVVSGTPVLTTSATSTSPGGTYPITPSIGTLSASNYVFTFVSGTLTITADSQTITFPGLPNIPQTNATVTLGATSTSGLAIVYTGLTGPATLGGPSLNVLTITGPGVVSVTATQPGNSSYTAATPVTQTFVVLATTTTVLTASAPTASQGTAVSLTAKVTSKTTGTLMGTVTFFAGTLQLGTPVTLSGGSAGLTTTAIPSGAVNLSAVYSGDGTFAASTSAIVPVLIVASDFNVSATSTNLAIPVGASVSTVITLTPVGGYANTVSFSCPGLLANLTCTFSPPALNFYPGTGTATSAQSVTLKVAATAQFAGLRSPEKPNGREWLLAGLMGPLLLFIASRRRRKLPSLLLVGLMVMMLGVATGCGSVDGTAASPNSTHNIQVLFNDGTPVTHSLTITVTVQ